MRTSDIVKTPVDLTSLQWHEGHGALSNSGSFLKASTGAGTGTVFYKASTYDANYGFIGHECVNEVVASRLMEILGVPHVRYSLIHARIRIAEKEYLTWINASKSYRRSSEDKMTLGNYFELEHLPGEDPLAFCDRAGWGIPIRQMMLVDYLLINQDRHGGNIEVLRTNNGAVRLAPVFDTGNSLLFSCYDVEEDIRAFDPFIDAIGTNFVGSPKLRENLQHIPANITAPLLPSHRQTLLQGLDEALPAWHLDKIWEIIWKRWEIARV